jgi:hypothetical protein
LWFLSSETVTESTVIVGNFNPKHGICGFKILHPCPVLAKTSISTMDVHMYKVCGSEPARFCTANDFNLEFQKCAGLGLSWMPPLLRL